MIVKFAKLIFQKISKRCHQLKSKTSYVSAINC